MRDKVGQPRRKYGLGKSYRAKANASIWGSANGGDRQLGTGNGAGAKIRFRDREGEESKPGPSSRLLPVVWG